MKKRTVIKLIVIAITCIAIVVLIIVFAKGINPPLDPKKTEYVRKISERTEKEIDKQSFDFATSNFVDLKDDITTDLSINNIEDNVAQECYKVIFNAYYPKFSEEALNIFLSQSVWDDNQIRFIREHADTLLAMNVAKPGSDAKVDLCWMVNVANDYFAAKSFVQSRKGRHCISSNDVNSVISRANSYKKKPLTNNSKLIAQLNEVITQAKQSFYDYVISECNSVCNTNYYSDAALKQDRQRAIRLINDYSNAYGTNSELNAVTRRIMDKQSESVNINNIF